MRKPAIHIPAILAVLLLGLAPSVRAQAQAPQKGRTHHATPIRFSLNAFSFNDLLLARNSRDSLPVYTVSNLLDWCAAQDLEAVDITGYYFPGYPAVPSDELIRRVREKAARLGLSISGTGIRNNFASPDPAVRKADVELAKRWIDVAAKLGAPVLRLFTGAVPKGYEDRWQEVADWMTPCFRECADYAAARGVKIGIQNHADMLSTADQCLRLLKAVDHPAAGLIVDTGSFTTADPYDDIARTAHLAINWQVKVSLHGKPVRKTDYKKVMGILKASGYKGFLPVETLATKGVPYDPFELVPAMLHEMGEARREVFR